ncbi:hypothetical protein [Bizionia psychrotolerans]|uniref:hypothetical protein n=1 Tax=Bizionia psychrotolerans TaxID=1492901 RepID=UPI0006524FF9|nr:hypothetical protein [Bizionia psychrotolerans]
MNENWFEILKFLGFAAGGITLWYKDVIAMKLGIKKGKKDLQGDSLNNLQKNMDLYQELLNDMDLRYKARISDISDEFNASMTVLRAELDDLRHLNEKLKLVNEEQDALIKKQSKRLNYYNNKYGEIAP